ncbi:preprotein translocase subunit SecG [Larsenimonas suaedae]|uniref:Protein-export membrane protein SecG n=1 Tax=Larsenimonas suaedae TaxID=1851019 RepID=A0ABU1GYW7_9GAMM|nr:preprotein translocase subunit SecG [Larsenimonas suaedae]MCM2973590.1 preprotein translocase subunit SecG [Larsenimonas suaedae]MDR5897040.1 preprotein translocase subunit SecG [Larsenimonas suaedae]
MQVAILLVHVVLAIALIALVLIQQGKGAEAGAAFGGGASQTVFGSQGSTSFLAKFTGLLAALFFVTSLALAWFVSHDSSDESGIPDATVIEQQKSLSPTLDDGDSAAGSERAQERGDASEGSGLTAPSASDQNNSTQALDESGSSLDNSAPASGDKETGSSGQ